MCIKKIDTRGTFKVFKGLKWVRDNYKKGDRP